MSPDLLRFTLEQSGQHSDGTQSRNSRHMDGGGISVITQPGGSTTFLAPEASDHKLKVPKTQKSYRYSLK